MSGTQPLSVTINDDMIINIKTVAAKKPLSIGLVGNYAEILPQLMKKGLIPDIVTDQISAHDLMDYVPVGDFKKVMKLKKSNPEEYKKIF